MEYKFKFVEVSDFEFKMSRLQGRPVKAVELIEQIIAHGEVFCRVDMAGVILGVHKATEQPPDGTICTVTWDGEGATIEDVQWHLDRINKTHAITGLEKTAVRVLGKILTCVLAEKRELYSQSGELVGVMTYPVKSDYQDCIIPPYTDEQIEVLNEIRAKERDLMNWLMR